MHYLCGKFLDNRGLEATQDTQSLVETSGCEMNTAVRTGRATYVCPRASDTPLLGYNGNSNGMARFKSECGNSVLQPRLLCHPAWYLMVRIYLAEICDPAIRISLDKVV